jgi:hypothetical protein
MFDRSVAVPHLSVIKISPKGRRNDGRDDNCCTGAEECR